MGIELAPDTIGLLRIDDLLEPVYAPLTIYCSFKIKEISDDADVMDLQPFKLQHWSGTTFGGVGSIKFTIYSSASSSTSTLRFHVNDDEDNSHISQILSEPNVNLDNRWIHMMGVMPGVRGKAKLYMDSESGDTITGSSPSDLPIDLAGFNDVEFFGANTFKAGDNVILDSVIIWNTALTDSDFTNLKNNVDPLQIEPSSIVYAPDLRTDWASGDIEDQSSSGADIANGVIPGTWSYSSESYTLVDLPTSFYNTEDTKMKNLIKEGGVVSFLAGADISSNAVTPLGDQGVYGIATNDVASGEVGEAAISGVFEIPCAAGFTPDAFDPVYWDVADGEANADSANPPIGYAIPFDATTAAAKEATGSTVLRVLWVLPPLAVS